MARPLVKSITSSFFLSYYLLFLTAATPVATPVANDPLLKILDKELQREWVALKKEAVPPYFIAYQVIETEEISLASSFGALEVDQSRHRRLLTVEVRVGDYTFDNTHPDSGAGRFSLRSAIPLPLEENELAISQILWRETQRQYSAAVEHIAQLRAKESIRVAREATDDFAKLSTTVDGVFKEDIAADLMSVRAEWAPRVRALSQPFLRHPSIFGGSANLHITRERRYLVSSEGTRLRHDSMGSRLNINGFIKASDGMELPLYRTWFSRTPKGLPPQATLLQAVDDVVDKLIVLRGAPVTEPYVGPAILAGRPAAVFFHEILGHRLEGHRQRSEQEGQTFTQKLGEPVLPLFLSIESDPTRKVIG
ncbi:hypothetical protein KAI87_17440, partial [Myxococcota bacterium]|nr:hypothetical protein [Myxococcota bacterium]